MFGAIMDLAGQFLGMSHAEEQQEDQQNFNENQTAAARHFNREERIASHEFNSAQAIAQRDWAERLSNTQYQRAIGDMKAAGLNPMLAYHQGGAGTPSGSAAAGGAASAQPASSGIATSSGKHSFAAGLQSASQVEVNEALVDRTRAEASKIKAEEEEIRERTPTHAVNIQSTQQNIKESIARIERIAEELPKLRQETVTSAAAASHYSQQVSNLKETIPVLKETVKQLRALTELNKAQAIEAGARTTVSDATYDEIRQRTRANLPEIERAIKQLEEKAQQLSMHGRGMDAAASAGFLGALRAAIRALTGQQSIMGK